MTLKSPKTSGWRGVSTTLICLWGITLLSLALYLRLHRITEEGLNEEDSVGYYLVAKSWTQGEKNLWWDQFYRPAIYAVDAAAVRWIGDNDYSVKLLNTGFEVASFVLMILIGRQLTGKCFAGLLAIQMYMLLPFTVMYCRTFMPHTKSTAFVLAALAAFYAGRRPGLALRWRLVRDFAAGLLLGVAANTHGELSLLGPGFFTCQCVEEYTARSGWVRGIFRVVGRGFFLTTGFVIPFAAGVAYFGYKRVVQVLSVEFGQSLHTPSYIHKTPLYEVPYRIFSITSQTIYGNAWLLPLLAVLPVVIWAIMLAMSRKRYPLVGRIPIILIAVYALQFPFTVGAFDDSYVRLFMPLWPLIFLAFGSAIWHLSSLVSSGRRYIIPVTILAVLAIFTPNAIAKPYYFDDPRAFHKSRFRGIYDMLGTKVSDKNRLLIVPAAAYHNFGYQTSFYFGKNAHFLSEFARHEPYTAELLKAKIVQGSFSYIYDSNRIDARFNVVGWVRFPTDLPWFRDEDIPGYTVDSERKIVSDALNSVGADLLVTSPWGNIYSRRKRPLFPNSDFGKGVLDHWHPSGFAMMFALERESLSPASEPIVLRERQSLREPATYGKHESVYRYRINTRAADRSGEEISARFGREPLKGELISDVFVIEEPVIGFWIAGQGDSRKVNVSLLLDDTELLMAPPSLLMSNTRWDVSAYMGQRARIAIRDADPASENGIEVSGFYYVY